MTSRYTNLFKSLPSGVHAAPRLTGPLRAAAKRAGIAWYDLDLKGVADRQALLRRCAEVFALPAHFGENWDALHECLRELAGSGAPGAVVHWRRGPELARRAPEALATALEILDDAARYWRSSGRVFVVAVDRDSGRGFALRPLR
ncbi:MAG TPA: barstar family protein [Burkholderiales bacterium]|nr:barstar family protein [Burkholderiales bacterium]